MTAQERSIGKRLISIDELSEYIGFPKGTLYNWVSERKIECIKLGKHLRFDKEVINQWIEKNRQQVHKDVQ